MDYLCEHANTFNEALYKIAAYEYDCTLLDLMLPDGSGLDILRIIKKESPQTGVIIVSAKDSLDDKVEGLKIGADDYLPKHFLLPKLSMSIFALMRRKKFTSDNTLHAGLLTSLGYKVNTTLPDTKCEITANRTLFESLVNNLVVNALRNSGQVNISLAEGKLMISNPSDNGEPLNSSRLFQRFASTSGTKGNGLGLAIAKAVCDVHRWKIKYDVVSFNHLFTVVMNGMIQK